METLAPMNIRIPSPYSPTSTELFDWEVFLREAFSLVNKMAIVGKTNIVNTAEYDTDAQALQKAIDTDGVLYVRKGATFTIGSGVTLPSSGRIKVILEDTATLNIDVSFPTYLGLTVIGGSQCTVNINATQTIGTDWVIKLENSAYVTVSQNITMLGLFVLTANSGILSMTASFLKNTNGSIILDGFDVSLASNRKLVGVTGTQSSLTGFAIFRRIRIINTTTRTDWSIHFRYFGRVIFEDCYFEEQVSHSQRTIQVDVTEYVYFVRCRFKMFSHNNPPALFVYAKEVYFFQCSGLNSYIRVFPANNIPSVFSEHCSLFVFDCIFETNTATGNFGIFQCSLVSGDKGIKVFCKRTFFKDLSTSTNNNASYGFIVEDPIVVSLDDVVADNIGLFGTSTTKSFVEPTSVSVNNCEVRNNKWVAIYLDVIGHVSVTNCRFYGAKLYDDTAYYGNVLYGACIVYNIPNSHYAGFVWTSSEYPAIIRFENNTFHHYPRFGIRLRYTNYTGTDPFFTVMKILNNSFELISYWACVSSGNRSTWESTNGTEENRSVAIMCLRNQTGSGAGSQKRPVIVGNNFYRCYMAIFINAPAEQQIIANNVLNTYSESISYSIQIKLAGDNTCHVFLTNTTAPQRSTNTVKASDLFALRIAGWVGYIHPIDNTLYTNVSMLTVTGVYGYFTADIQNFRGQPIEGTIYSSGLSTPLHDFLIINGVAYGWVPTMIYPQLRLPNGLQPTTAKQVAGINYPAYPISETDYVFFSNIADILGSLEVPVGRSGIYLLVYWESIPSQQNITIQLQKRNLTDAGGTWNTISSTGITINGTSFSVVSFAGSDIEFQKREVYRFRLQSNPTGGSVYILSAQVTSLFRQELTV